jgi:hypothetical protein
MRAVAALGELIKLTLDRLDGSVPPRPDGNGTSGGGVSTPWTAQLTTGTGRSAFGDWPMQRGSPS